MAYADIAPLYAGLALRERCYARIRYATAPLEAVAALVPAGARTCVELGCSAGVFANVLKTRRPDISVIGVDADERKVATARATVRGRPGIAFEVADAFAYLAAARDLDAVAFVDVLYLFPPERQDALLRQAAAALAGGGHLIVKEMTDRPAWKRRWCLTQEWLAVRVVGFTQGAGIYLRPGASYGAALAACGLAVEEFDLARGYPYPHHAWRGTEK